MKDKIIISTISKTHSAIVTLLSFIFVSFILIFIVLQNGLYLENISFANIHVKKLFIKWNERLSLSMSDLYVEAPTGKTKQQHPFDKKNIADFTRHTYSFLAFFEKIDIENFHYRGIDATLHYNPLKTSKLFIQSDDFSADFNLKVYPDYADFSIKKLFLKNTDTNLQGNIYINLRTLELYGKTDILLAKKVATQLLFKTENKKVYYQALSSHKVVHTEYKELLTQLKLPDFLHYWLLDALTFKYARLQKLQGYIDLQHPDEALKHLYVEADVYGVSYAYNPELAPVNSPVVRLVFQNKKLFINPKDPKSYRFALKKSHLDIDFSKADVYLNLYLDFEGTLNEDILQILHTYTIDLPLRQHSGTTHAKIDLHLNLKKLHPDIRGKFYTSQGEFEYDNKLFLVENATLSLNNSKLSLKKGRLQYEQLFDANLSLQYNLAEKKGNIDANLTMLHLGEDFSLAKPADVHCALKGNLTTCKAADATWRYKEFNISTKESELTFDISQKTLQIAPSLFEVKNTSKGYLSGTYDFHANTALFHLDILDFNYRGVSLLQSNTPLEIAYDKKLLITSDEPLHLDVVKTKVKLQNLKLYTKKGNIYVKTSQLIVGDYLRTKLSARIDANNKVHFTLNNLLATDKKKILYKSNKISLNAFMQKEGFVINSDALRAKFTLGEKLWRLELGSLNSLYRKSPFLQKYKLSHGNITIHKKADTPSVFIDASLKNYPYRFFTNGTNDYTLHGKLTKKKLLYLTLNDMVQIKIDKQINLDIRDTSIFLPDVLTMTKDFSSKESNKSNETEEEKLNINIAATDTNITLDDNRTILADKINFQYYNSIASAQLLHKSGKAGLKLEKEKFSIYGKNFNDDFMNALFAFSKFKGGHLDFSVNGTLEDYSGIFYIEKTRLMEYTVLNNVLAFINTVPSLVTFSLPGYTKNGIKVNHAYLKFHYKDDKFHISDMYMDSKEVKISSKGVVDMKSNTINMLMTLKTDIASDISKIPVVGYILFDGKALSTTFEIVGKLEDPQVKSQLAKEVIVAPLNIIKRTLQLPLKIFE